MGLPQEFEARRQRSNFIKTLVQDAPQPAVRGVSTVPKTIVQFWHRRDQLPDDVKDCMRSWQSLQTQGYEYLLFDGEGAGAFIEQQLGERYRRAYERCYHPAMRSDYFRLCYISVKGGFYVDVDDVYLGGSLDALFSGDCLYLQPLCYDTATASMVAPAVFTAKGAFSPDWIFYFNNNPLIAPARHPVVDQALSRSTLLLERCTSELPEIQETTGPGNLSRTLFELDRLSQIATRSVVRVLADWESTAATKWELSYRHDARNWRLSNQKQPQA